jgi:hypothetical protein
MPELDGRMSGCHLNYLHIARLRRFCRAIHRIGRLLTKDGSLDIAEDNGPR